MNRRFPQCPRTSPLDRENPERFQVPRGGVGIWSANRNLGLQALPHRDRLDAWTTADFSCFHRLLRLSARLDTCRDPSRRPPRKPYVICEFTV